MELNRERSIALRPSHELTATQIMRNRILGEMVESSLVLAKEITPGNVDLDALVRDGKRIRNGEGMTPENIQAFNLFYRAAAAGHREAQFEVFICYKSERGVKQDCAKALEWLRKSADAGFARAFNRLALEYTWGRLIPKDENEAIKWYQKAAKDGTKNYIYIASGRLAGIFRERKDFAAALKCDERAAEIDCESLYYLVRDYEHGNREKGIPQDYSEAAKWCRFGAEQGDWDFIKRLAKCYEKGQGVAQDHAEAVKWYRKAAENGDVRAQYMLGCKYREGEGVPQDDAEAADWFRKVANTWLRYATNPAGKEPWQYKYRLGCCYRDGEGVEVDLPRAYGWLQLAADQGHTEAQEEVTALVALISLSDFVRGHQLYQEFKEKYSGKR